jgi:pimeloyl-ACP methyl ester carboxylesterase
MPNRPPVRAVRAPSAQPVRRGCARALPAVLTALLLAVAPADTTAQTPIVFVHGNGDHAGLWDTTIWRFESNGWPADRLFAVDLPHPTATSRVRVREVNRSTPDEQAADLAAFVTRVLLRTGASHVALVGSSRGGMTIRHYLRHGGGAAHVSHAILAGAPNHGVFALPALQPESEFNGAGPYLQSLNAGSEVVAGVRFLTIRSDSADKYAQPDGAALGMPGVPTNVDASGPALAGAADVVLPGADHREVAFAEDAFVAMYRFLAGREPATRAIVTDSVAVLDGLVSGTENGAPTNRPLPGARVTVYRVDPATGAREGEALHDRVVDFTGRWGPFRADPRHTYEFALATPDSSGVLHVFRPPFPRGSAIVNFRLGSPPTVRGDSTVVTLLRPRGYLGAGRDTVRLDGEPARGIPPGVPTVDRASVRVPATTPRSVRLEFNGHVLTVQTRGADPRRSIIGEFVRD